LFKHPFSSLVVICLYFSQDRGAPDRRIGYPTAVLDVRLYY
jgi:hypothetical protein